MERIKKMPKQKTKKSLFKRLKISSSNKLFRRHQLSAGHLKRNKTKNATNRAKKGVQIFKGDSQNMKKLLGI